MILLEPAVALTDLGLAVENAAFAGLLARLPSSDTTMRLWWMLFFAGLALAALLGFVSHGLLADKLLPLHQWIWSGTLLSIGVIALAATAVAAGLALDTRLARTVVRVAVLLLAIYVAVVVAGYRSFGLAVAAYAPATLFLLVAFVHRTRQDPAHHWRLGIGGLALTAVAATIQQLGIGLHPENFNHNALYHVIQALALWMLYGTARASLRAGARAYLD